MQTILRVILYIIGFCGFFAGIYFTMRYAIHDEISAVVTDSIRGAMREEFTRDRQEFKFVIED